MSSGTSQQWLEDLRGSVQSQAIKEALSDVPDTGDDSVVTWIKYEPAGDRDKETVFVLAGRLLHQLSGQIESAERQPEEGVWRCDYGVLVISDQSNYSIRLERGRQGDNVAWVKRWWTFEFVPDETGLEIEYSAGNATKQSPGPDPTPFAQALIRAIADAQAEK
jgi:hypothetical protein